jgi:hypothetical protein
MKTYKIYIKKDKKGVFEDVLLIKEGFIFSAFIFNIFWLLYKKIFKIALIIFAIFLAMILIEERYPAYSAFLAPIQLGVLFYIGSEGSDWFGKTLERKGYNFLGYSSGKNSQEARLRFLDKINEKNQKGLKTKMF